ncbi:MAG TPA: hypothetical protein PLQ89_01380 [Phycisphaerae bacterium]|nr:hypothetical protein [Phycisphaerae bacterium]HON66061.1 hypothetical protein [Phycisphaerae bacterium]HOQ84344.1 hypothetical protein [Phycisphaerae bacterium]HPU25096.1 hypothetical protein [Phycisphaerae bacterium]
MTSRSIGYGMTAILAAAALLTGCTAPMEPTTPTSMRVTVESPEQFEALWQATGDTLRKYYLQPDRQDRAEGVITTRPETTGVWFEPWRPQPQPAYAWAEANLHPIRRQAVVTITPTARPEYELTVEVNRYRYSLPERLVDNPAGVLRLYSPAAPTATGRMEKTTDIERWIPLGRDGWMEQAILTDILQRYPGTATVPPAEPAPSPSTQPAAS